MKNKKTNKEILKSKKAKHIYKILTDNFDRALRFSPHMLKALHSKPTVMGSTTYFETLTCELIRGIS